MGIIENRVKFGFKLSEVGKREALAALHSQQYNNPVVMLTFGVSENTIINLRRAGKGGMYKEAFAEMEADKQAFFDKYLTKDLIDRLDAAAAQHKKTVERAALQRMERQLEERKRAFEGETPAAKL